VNKWGRSVVTVWAVVAIILLLFPPFVYRPEGGAANVGWGFLFTGAFKTGVGSVAVVNVPLLALIETVLAAAAVGLILSRRFER